MLAFERRGQGRPVVLVHGITESRHTWDPLVPALAAGHDVVSVDLRGHGESEGGPPFDLETLASDVHEVVASEGMGPPLVVGHSLGGVVATAYAALFECRGVVDIDQPLALAPFQAALRALDPLLRGDEASFQRAIAMVFASGRGALSDDEMRRVDSIRDARQDTVLGIWSPILEGSPEDLAATIRGLCAAVSAPYLSLHGGDPGPGYRLWLGQMIAGSRVEVWDGTGHYPQLVEPARFLALLGDFEASAGG